MGSTPTSVTQYAHMVEWQTRYAKNVELRGIVGSTPTVGTNTFVVQLVETQQAQNL